MRILHALPLAIVCLVGCGGPSLAGKWDTKAAGAPPGSKAVTEFTGSTFTMGLDMGQGDQSLHIDFSGDYTFDGKKLKMVGKKVVVDDSKIPAQFKSQVKAIQPMLEQQLLKTEEGDLKLEGDVATFNNGKTTTTFTKIK